MSGFEFVIAFLLVGLLAFQIFVTLRVFRSDLYDRSQKVNQAKLIWLVPALGAIIAFSVLRAEEPPRSDSSAQRRS